MEKLQMLNEILELLNFLDGHLPSVSEGVLGTLYQWRFKHGMGMKSPFTVRMEIWETGHISINIIRGIVLAHFEMQKPGDCIIYRDGRERRFPISSH